MPYADIYKKKGSRYEDKRSIRAVLKERDRRESRHKGFFSRRNIDEDILKPLVENGTSSIKAEMGIRLLEWKQKKQREKQAAFDKKNKKPPFVVGVVRHKMVPQFPSPVNSGKQSKALERTFLSSLHQVLVEKGFAPLSHQFKAPSSVVPIQMTSSRSRQNAENLSNKRLKKEASSTSASLKKLNAKTCIKSRTDVQPRRSARLSSKPMKTLESKKSKVSKAQIVSKNLQTIEECQSVDKTSSMHPRTSQESEEDKKDLPSSPNYGSFSPFYKKGGKDQLNQTKKTETPTWSRGKQHASPEEEEHTKDSVTCPIYAATLSPFICKKRGKDRYESPSKKPQTPARSRESGGLRKQIAKKIIEEKINDHSTIEKKERLSITKENFFAPSPSEDQNITSFRKLHSDEMKRIGSLCLEWDALLMSDGIPSEIQDSIRSIVCQGRLLMREKLAQFKELVDKSARCGPNTKCKVTHSDLQGFWDLVSIPIEDINNKFKMLDDLKGNDWVEVEKKESERKQRIRKVKREPMKTKIVNVDKKSAFKLFLLEQKKKLKDTADQAAVMISTPSSKTPKGSPKQRTRSGKKSIAASKEGESPSVVGNPRRDTLRGGTPSISSTPKRVTFRGLDGEKETPRRKHPATPHTKKGLERDSGTPKIKHSATPRTKKVSFESSKIRRSWRITKDSCSSSDEG